MSLVKKALVLERSNTEVKLSSFAFANNCRVSRQRKFRSISLSRIGVGGQDQRFLEPNSSAKEQSSAPENDDTFDPQLLSQAFAEMENWSDQLLHNEEVLEALQSLSDGEELAVHKMRRRGPALRGPSR